jgi:hypothetical protein
MDEPPVFAGRLRAACAQEEDSGDRRRSEVAAASTEKDIVDQ